MSASFLWIFFPERPYRMIYGNFASSGGAIAWKNEAEYWVWRPGDSFQRDLSAIEPDIELRELVAKDGHYWFETWSTAYEHRYYQHSSNKCWELAPDDVWEYTNFEWVPRPDGGRRYNSARWLYKERWLRKEEGMSQDFKEYLESRSWTPETMYTLSDTVPIWKPAEPVDKAELEVNLNAV